MCCDGERFGEYAFLQADVWGEGVEEIGGQFETLGEEAMGRWGTGGEGHAWTEVVSAGFAGGA